MSKNTNAGGGEAVEREALLLTSAEEVAKWVTQRLSVTDWRPNRADIEAARNAIQDATGAGRRLAALSAQSTGSGGVAAEPSEAALHAAMDAFYPGEDWGTDLGCALETSLRDMRAALKAARAIDGAGVAAEPVAWRTLRHQAQRMIEDAGWKPGDQMHGMALIELMVKFGQQVREQAAEERCNYPDCGCDHDAVCETGVRILAAAPTPPAGGGETDEELGREAIKRLEGELGVRGTAAVFRKALALAKEARATAPAAPRKGPTEQAWRPMSSAPKDGKTQIVAKHRPNEHTPDGWIATITIDPDDGEYRRGGLDTIKHYNGDALMHGFHGVWMGRLYPHEVGLTPADRGETQAVQDGWQIVPVEPNDEMRRAARGWGVGAHTADNAYRAMLAAAPSPDQNRGEPDQGGEAR